eukprot:scaffold350342_cov22-Prasinocladus_malaysianus.AAC.1
MRTESQAAASYCSEPSCDVHTQKESFSQEAHMQWLGSFSPSTNLMGTSQGSSLGAAQGGPAVVCFPSGEDLTLADELFKASMLVLASRQTDRQTDK